MPVAAALADTLRLADPVSVVVVVALIVTLRLGEVVCDIVALGLGVVSCGAVVLADTLSLGDEAIDAEDVPVCVGERVERADMVPEWLSLRDAVLL